MKIKTLLKRLSKFDPEMDVAVMVAGATDMGKNKPMQHDYMFAYKLKIVDDYTMYSPKEKMCVIFGGLEEIQTS